jgi:hypothetical protein
MRLFGMRDGSKRSVAVHLRRDSVILVDVLRNHCGDMVESGTLPSHIEEMREAGYSAYVFDMDPWRPRSWSCFFRAEFEFECVL